MYQNDKIGRKERRRDARRLWKLLRDEGADFPEGLDWLVRNAKESDGVRSVECVLALLLEAAIKVNNRLFLGRTYWNSRSLRVKPVYRLLMRDGYARTIYRLAIGAAYLYERTEHRGYRASVEILEKQAEEYRVWAEYHPDKPDADANSKPQSDRWTMIRISNCVIATVIDRLELGVYGGNDFFPPYGYVNFLIYSEKPRELSYSDYILPFLNPRKYRWKRFKEKLKPPLRNKRKRVNWRSVSRTQASV